MALEAGKLYRFPDGSVVEVIKVDFSGAVVRPVAKRRREFTDQRTGETVSFEAPSRSLIISANSQIEEV
jgi:hypothetical protein